VKTRYFLFLSYNGASYYGWQVQPEAITVQSVTEAALTTILNEETRTTGAGRTDTGVHASFFCAHFESSLANLDTDSKLVFRLNSYLPRDISVMCIRKVTPEAHARFSATSRTYKYYISRVKDPFCGNQSWYIYGNIDVEMMNRACLILGRHVDFTSFSRLHSDTKTNNCRIFSAHWDEDQKENKLVFTITADRFLRNMVRAIVGTMVDLGRGKTSLEKFEEIIAAHDRGMAGKSAPAQGLFLTGIEYPGDVYV